MIRYALACEHGHDFEGWFSVSSDFDDQAARGLLSCPICASARVGKQIMAPAIARRAPLPEPVAAPSPHLEKRTQAMMMRESLARLRAHVEESFDYVGDRFAREARAIHEGRAEERGIYGEASAREVEALIADGVPVAPLPPEPPKKREVN